MNKFDYIDRQGFSSALAKPPSFGQNMKELIDCSKVCPFVFVFTWIHGCKIIRCRWRLRGPGLSMLGPAGAAEELESHRLEDRNLKRRVSSGWAAITPVLGRSYDISARRTIRSHRTPSAEKDIRHHSLRSGNGVESNFAPLTTSYKNDYFKLGVQSAKSEMWSRVPVTVSVSFSPSSLKLRIHLL